MVRRCVLQRYVVLLPDDPEPGNNFGKLRARRGLLSPAHSDYLGDLLSPLVIVRDIRSLVLLCGWRI